jgi:CheY-like chemotaxis protein
MGSLAFLFVDESLPGANKARLSLADYQGAKAVRVKLFGSGVPYIAIDASGILVERVRDLQEMLVTIAVEHPGGEFYAVFGDIHAHSGADRLESADPWSVYLPNKNPNTARAILDEETEYFVPGAYNFFVLTRKVDNALGEGKEPCDLFITEIRFLDADDGMEALSRFSASTPGYYDLIFMDVQMPNMDGYEVTRRIRALSRKDAQAIPIIAMTANVYREDIDHALAAGMNGHLAKPIDIGAVLKTLNKWLGNGE